MWCIAFFYIVDAAQNDQNKSNHEVLLSKETNLIPNRVFFLEQFHKRNKKKLSSLSLIHEKCSRILKT